MSVKLTEIEKEILSRGISVGNEVLYTLCRDYPLLKEKNPKNMNERRLQGLAAELWLIGRSYAASPERRDYGEKIEWTNSGNGLDTYFDLLAEKLWSDGYYDELEKIVENLEEMNRIGYKFDQSFQENDKNILASVIANVLKFNALLKEIRYAVDEKELLNHVGGDKEKIEVLKNNQKNMLSFSSKFLHFHFPDVVFIIDTITMEHFKGPRGIHHFKFEKANGDLEGSITFSKEEMNEMISDVSKIKYKDDSIEIGKYDKAEEYITHCVREYLLAREIKKVSPKIFDGEGIHIPHLIDTYMLMTNPKTKKEE